jgi:hypothetical protein
MFNKNFGVSAIGFLLLFTAACSILFPCSPGATIDIVSSPPFDTVILQRDAPQIQGCCSDVNFNGCPSCFSFAAVPLDRNGSGFATGLVDETAYLGTGLSSGCSMITPVQCEQTVSDQCVVPASGSTVIPYGTINIVGIGVVCRIPPPPAPTNGATPATAGTICNSGDIFVNINGATVSASFIKGTTATQVATKLANAIDTTPALVGVVVAGASGNAVNVSGRAVSPQAVTYYRWDTSCTYDTDNFSMCAFHANMSPLGTMGTRPPL